MPAVLGGSYSLWQVTGKQLDGAWPTQVYSPAPPQYLWSWGFNSTGQLGLGNSTDYSSPKQIGSLSNWQSTSSGFTHSLAVKTDGTLWAWGGAGYGRLGLGPIVARNSPTQVGALTNWLNTGTGREHSLATKTDGTLWAWGNGTQG
jgi:alpha-tubulin suppressor-like RCC1 family protein